MSINEIIVYLMVVFMALGAFDRILGNRFGLGEKFEEGIMAMGSLALAMIGIICLAPVLANLLRPVVVPLYQALGADPAMFAGTLLANDMGGAPLAQELALTQEAGQFGGLIVGSMLGPTIVFTIPVGLGIIKAEDRPYLATGVLAFSCARNIVIVGDLKQLPNVLTEDDIRTSDAIWQKYSLDERYRFSTHSLLSSALEIWQDAPVTLLREHYRCHPKIINFCNQKFYHGQLIVMTKDHDEPDVLTMYRTIAGNHARGHLNQRQIDVIQQEVLPRLHQQNFQSIGIITPYRDQVTAIRKQLGDTYEVDTVHKFQGREQDAIILTSVDNVITDFVDDPHMLNVAVSRAVHSLAVVTSQDPRNDQTNYGDLTRYIEYNNFEVIQSQVYSVFDMLYQGYAEQRRAYLQKHKRVSEYDSENLMYSVIQEVLSEEAFSSIGCAVHVSLATLVKDYEPLTEEERQYARNLLTHVDFLLFNQMDKQPVLAIEVDGTGFHEAGSKQAERDMKKNSVLEKCAVPFLRLRTDGSGEKEKIRTALKGE